jgi:hypothetical protein
MSEIIQGTLRADGIVELDGKPTLPPGRVQVVIEPLASAKEPSRPPRESWWEYMQRARQVLEESGHPFLNEGEMTIRVEELREDDDRIDRASGRGDVAEGKK